jgi:hypothetical protein
MTFDSFRLLNCHPCVISEDSELMFYCWRHTFLGYHVTFSELRNLKILYMSRNARLQKIEDMAFNVSSLQSLYFRQNHFQFNKNVNKKYRPKTLFKYCPDLTGTNVLLLASHIFGISCIKFPFKLSSCIVTIPSRSMFLMEFLARFKHFRFFRSENTLSSKLWILFLAKDTSFRISIEWKGVFF